MVENRHKTMLFLVKTRRIMATIPKIGRELQKIDFGKLDGRKKSIFGGFWESVGNLKLAENGDRSLGSIDSRRVRDDVVRLCACLAGLAVIPARVGEEFIGFFVPEVAQNCEHVP